MSTTDHTTAADTLPPRGRMVVRPGADPLAMLEVAAAQMDALHATLSALAGCFAAVPAPTPADTAPPRKAPPRTYGRRPASPPESTPPATSSE